MRKSEKVDLNSSLDLMGLQASYRHFKPPPNLFFMYIELKTKGLSTTNGNLQMTQGLTQQDIPTNIFS